MRAFVTYIFLRLYARALSRDRRNAPAEACSDAIMQTAMFATPLIGAPLLLVTALAWPTSIRHLEALDATFISAAVLLAALVTYPIYRQFRTYALTPSAADTYRAPDICRRTRILFVSVPVLAICLTGILLRLATVMGRLP